MIFTAEAVEELMFISFIFIIHIYYMHVKQKHVIVVAYFSLNIAI